MTASCLCVSSPNVTPFLITVQDALALDASEGFTILRQHLTKSIKDVFCSNHNPKNAEDLQSWLVMRDILHALLAPIVALQDHAVRVAQTYTRSARPEDLEYAYKGKGRNAFVWLQSFLASDELWCLSTGCPGCIVEQALDAEFQIRMIIASCLLSDIESADDDRTDRPTLPSFEFFLNSLKDAMDEDQLWGPGLYAIMEPKAWILRKGISDLMAQCQAIEAVVFQSGDSASSSDEYDEESYGCEEMDRVDSCNVSPAKETSFPPLEKLSMLDLRDGLAVDEEDETSDNDKKMVGKHSIRRMPKMSTLKMNSGSMTTTTLSKGRSGSVVGGMKVKRSEFAQKQARMLAEEQQWLKRSNSHGHTHGSKGFTAIIGGGKAKSTVTGTAASNVSVGHGKSGYAFASPVTTEFVRRLSSAIAIHA